MRHFCLTITITALSGSVVETARSTQLIVLTGFLQGLISCQLCTITGTVTLSTVATTADQYRCVTAGAKIVSGGRFHRQ
jgi:hypothetical protein